jgi:Uma2 family endonuclease
VKNLLISLHSQLDPQRWEVVTEFGLDAGPQTLRYPDVLIDEVSGADEDRTAVSPALVTEVLSPSTAEIYLADKAAEYLNLASVNTYLVFSQDEPKVWIWLRGDKGLPAGVKELAPELPLSAIYAGLPPN